MDEITPLKETEIQRHLEEGSENVPVRYVPIRYTDKDNFLGNFVPGGASLRQFKYPEARSLMYSMSGRTSQIRFPPGSLLLIGRGFFSIPFEIYLQEAHFLFRKVTAQM